VTKPEDWFYNAHQAGNYTSQPSTKIWVWDLPPAAALHAIEELGMARLKRHDQICGVLIIPTLLAHEWFRRFTRTVDFYFTVPAGSINEWPKGMHESLTIGCYFPLFRYHPWDWKRVPFLIPFGIAVSAMYKASDPLAGDILRQFWNARARVTSLPKRLVSNLLLSPSWRKFLSIQACG
jgi:hypothetical protein